MAELLARGPNPKKNEWRQPLPDSPVTLGRVAPASAWAVPWDRKISSQHATLHWRAGQLFVRRLPRALNPIFFLGQDQKFAEFAVAPGEAFVIGGTRFTVLQPQEEPAGEPSRTLALSKADLPPPHAELSYSAEELRQAKYLDADQRIEALAALPEVIRDSPSDAALEARVLEVLLRGVPPCTAAGVVRRGGATDAAAEVEVSTMAARDPGGEPLQTSRRLVLDALSRRQSVLYRWDTAGSRADFTAHVEVDWAICAPLPDEAGPDRGLYLMGRLHSLAREEHFKGDLKFVEAVAGIFGSLRQLRELQTERAQLHAALGVAQGIQADFFPRKLPQVPGYEMAGCSRPADATGGDYWDVLPQPGGGIGLVIADVSGHGLGPSLLMAALRATLRGLAARGAGPAELLTDVAAAMYDDLHPRHRFITLLYGVLGPTAHVFRYANAAHGPLALHFAADTGQFTSLAEDDGRGCPLGVLRETYQACAPRALACGDLLLLGSDGIVEARRGREQFGMERLEELVLRERHRPLPDLLAAVLEAATNFHEHGRPDDDLTLLLVRRTA